MFRRKKEEAAIAKPVLNVDLMNVNSILESKTGHFGTTRVSWWGWHEELVYTEQRPSVEIATDVIKVFQKYFPHSKVDHTSAEAIIRHPEYCTGDVSLAELKIDEVLALFQSGYVKKLLIHKNKLTDFDKSLRLLHSSGHDIKREYSYLKLYIPDRDIQKSTSNREYIHKSPKGPLHAELFISPSIERNNLLFARIYYELSAIKNPVLQNTNTEQFLDTSSLFKN